jgi:DNA mismatch repair protein MutL
MQEWRALEALALPSIRVLEDHLVNRIAAGEVVERPASVLKELLENALDAGASSIDVTVEDGGRRRVVVADDGCGMERDDALLALERHATSKLRRFEDLAAIGTLGFRGEALPAIAAVSRFTLRTAARDGHGTEIEVRGGRIDGVRDIAFPRGTTVEAASLFFNVPARRKFLKATPTELAHVVKLAGSYALARPAVRFRVDHDGRRLLEAPPASDRLERLAQVHGRGIAGRLVPFASSYPGLTVSGFAGRPVDALPRRDAQHLFVNGRRVQDRLLAHAIGQAYGDTTPRGSFPAAFVFVEIDPSAVDVNVHPQKSEVRFARSGEVHDAVREAVGRALADPRAVPRLAELRPQGPVSFAPVEVASGAFTVRESVPPPSLLDEGSPAALPGRTATPLAQYKDSYIVAQDALGIVLVDQHVAHERVLYEKYLADAEQDRVAVQRLLFPATLEVTAEQAVVVEEEAEELKRLGLLVEPFGDGTIRIDGIPSIAKDLAPQRLVAELLGEAARARSASTGSAVLRRKVVTSAACQAAIKVNYPLTREGMQALLDGLFATENPTTCPHGRPILFRLTLEEIERAFRRR